MEKIMENIELMEEIRQTKGYNIIDVEKINLFESIYFLIYNLDKMKQMNKLPLQITKEKIIKKREDHIMSKLYKLEDKFIEV